MSYDSKTDYQALINAEKAKGSSANSSYLSALESSRNEKISAMNNAGTNTNGYTATSNYTGGNSGGGTSYHSSGSSAAPVTTSNTTAPTYNPDSQAYYNYLQGLMNQNSNSWKNTSDPTQRDAYHQANLGLQSQIDKIRGTNTVYNPASGTYEQSSYPRANSQSMPENFGGSTTTYGNSDPFVQDINDKMNANSKAWWQTDDPTERARLHQENVSYAQQLSAYQSQNGNVTVNYSSVYDPSSGKWVNTPTYGQSEIRAPVSAEDYIRKMYAYNEQAAIQALKTAYDSNMQDVDAAQAKIAPLYQAQRNNAASQAAVSRANFNEQAAASGINTGAGSQAALSQANALNSNLNTLNGKEADANTDIINQRLKLQTQYSNAIAQAQMDNNSKLAEALYNEYVRVDNGLVDASQAQASLRAQQQASSAELAQQQWENQYKLAQEQAAWGDFSGLQALGVPAEDIAIMQQRWAAKNPLLAYGVALNYSTKSSGRSAGRKIKNGGSGGTPTYTPTSTSTVGTDSASNLKEIGLKLSKIEDSGGNVSSKAASIIKQYLNSKAISEATAKKLLAQYGL